MNSISITGDLNSPEFMRSEKRKKKVLFICTGNSCRSQMAEGLLRAMAGDRFQVYSAGTHPSHVHPMTIAVMSEIGIDLTNHRSEPIDSYHHADIDIVITVCDQANRLCPTFPGSVERIHWSIDDPFRNWDFNPSHLTPYREAREAIKNRIEDFLKTH